MSYEKTNWTSGDVITAEKLNHMEDGIGLAGGSALIVTGTDDGTQITLNKTFGEIKTAYNAGTPIFITITLSNGVYTDEEITQVISVKTSLENDEVYVGNVHVFLPSHNGNIIFEVSDNSEYPYCYYGD